MHTHPPETVPATDPFHQLAAAANTIGALRPLLRSLGADMTGMAVTRLGMRSPTIVLRMPARAADLVASQLGLEDRIQVRSERFWVRGYEGVVELYAGDEFFLRIAATADGPDDDCRTLTVGEMDRVAALYAAVSL